MTILAGTLVDRVAEILTRYNMLPEGAKVGVAVSGGADSVVLLHVLFSLADRFRVLLSVLHVNHGLRGAASDADEEFVGKLAASLGLPFLSSRVNLPVGNLEQEARNARRALFRTWSAEEGLARIALGHTRSDQAETVLFRLLRGSGISGLSGMRFVTSDNLIRPLLGLGREQVREWAIAEGIPWREDETNEDRRFVRNRIRLETLPSLSTTYNPNLESILANTAVVAQSEEDYWLAEIAPLADKFCVRTPFGLQISASALAGLHLAVQRRLMRHLLCRLRGDLRAIDLPHVDRILALCRSTQGHDRVLAPGVDALRSFDTLLLTEPGHLNADERQYCIPLFPSDWTRLPGAAGYLCLNRVNSETQFCANFKSVLDFSCEVAADVNRSVLTDAGLMRPLYVRNWEPGDEIHRAGHRQPEKLKTLFGEYRILLWERRHWPVVVCEGEVVWVKRFGCSVKFAASSQEKAVMRIECKQAGEEKAAD